MSTPSRSSIGCYALLTCAFTFLLSLAGLAFAFFLFRPNELSAALAAPPQFMLPSLVDTPLAGMVTEIRPTDAPTPTRLPTRAPTAAPTQRPTVPPSLTPYPSTVVTIGDQSITLVDHSILARPVGPNADSNRPDWYYLYGTTEQGALRVHHGVEFVNPEGTPALAVADGKVVVAANDEQPICGVSGRELCAYRTGFYGNLVVLQLDATYRGQSIYVLYGHLSQIGVRPGQRVRTGQVLGAIGMTGAADGPHVHLEVRIGVNDYAHTRDPLLWLAPLPGYGMLVGRVVDETGRPVVGAALDLYNASGQNQVQFSETYGSDDLPAVNPDDDARENFALGDLPPGQYLLRASWRGHDVRQSVTVVPGRLNYVVLKP